jgi:iron complex transport system substrate-binding protein
MTPSTRLAAALAVLTLAATACAGSDTATPTVAAAAGSGSYPVTVERCGRSFTYDQAPERILLGWGPSVATLDALGASDRAFGYLSGSLAAPPASAGLTQVSPDFVSAREVVLASRPDLVLANDENQVAGDQGGPSYDDLDAAGANVFVLGDYCQGTPAPTTVDAVYRDVRDLGAVLGVPGRASTLEADLRRRVAAAGAERGHRPQLTAAVVQSYDGKLYASSGSYYAAILTAAGLTNEFADLKENFAEISPEQVLARRPDVVLAVYEDAETEPTAIAAARTALAGSPAARSGRVYALSSAAIQSGGVTIVDLIEQTATAVYRR